MFLSCAAGVPFLITAELFKQSHRPAAYTVAGVLNWLSNFTIGFVFPFLEVRENASYSTFSSVHTECNLNYFAQKSFCVHFVGGCWLYCPEYCQYCKRTKVLFIWISSLVGIEELDFILTLHPGSVVAPLTESDTEQLWYGLFGLVRIEATPQIPIKLTTLLSLIVLGVVAV